MPAPPQPVAGYPSKGAAIEALSAEGKTPFMIAELIGSTPDAVSQRLRQLRKKAAGQPMKSSSRPPAAPTEPDTRGIWTPEKLDKARRLFGKTMIYIAEALEVPADELLRYALNGTLPPIGAGQRLGDLLAQMAENGAPLPVDVPALPAAEPSREDDEAELAALESTGDETEAEEPDDGVQETAAAAGGGNGDLAGSTEDGADLLSSPPPDPLGAQPVRQEAEPAPAPEPVAPPDAPPAAEAAQADDGASAAVSPAPAGLSIRTYRIKGKQAGTYLHKSETSFTRFVGHAWTGTAPAMERLFKRNPEYRELDPERVPG